MADQESNVDDRNEDEFPIARQFKMVIMIPTAGRQSLLERTLQSIEGCEKPDELMGTLVVENGPALGAEAVASANGATYLHVPAAGKSAALNRAFADYDPETLVVMFDDDVRLAPETLMEYANAARKSTGGVFFGGPMDVDYEESPPDWLTSYLPSSARGWGKKEAEETDPYFFIGNNWALFVSDLDRIDGFDPNYGPGSATGATGQEYNAQQRLHAIGMKPCFVENARVWHYVPKSRCSPDWIINRRRRNSHCDGRQREMSRAEIVSGRMRLAVWKLILHGVPFLGLRKRFQIRVIIGQWMGLLESQQVDQ